MTAEGFKAQVDEEWSHLKGSPSTLTDDQVTGMEAHFEPPAYAERPGAEAALAADRLKDADFARWVRHNVSPHKQAGYAIATLSTKETGTPPGDVSDRQMEAVADWAEAYGFGEIRISHQQNFVLPDVGQEQLYALWQAAQAKRLATPNRGLATDIICCPAATTARWPTPSPFQWRRPFRRNLRTTTTCMTWASSTSTFPAA